MAGVNKVIIVGRLGNDPEMRTMPNGDAVANISVATSDVWNDKQSGERREVTEWHRIILFRRLAEIAGEYLRKGSQVYVEGKLKTRKWQDQNGQDRYTTEIQADSLTLLGGRNDNESYAAGYAAAPQPGQKGAAKPAPQAEPPMNDFDDDIPFAPIHHAFSKHTIYAI